MPKASNLENWSQGQGNQVWIYGNYHLEGHYVREGNYNCQNNFNRGNYGNRNDRNGPYVPPQNREVTPRDGGDSMAQVEDMLHKMMRKFDASDEHTKELRNDLAGNGQKVDIHAISIKQLELQLAQLSATVNTHLRALFLETLSNNLKKMDSICQSLHGVVIRPFTHLCRLRKKCDKR